ncbi:NAD(P)-dependent oxidoreductase [Halobacteriovorax sp. CON-3]|uniref:NAD(P)-dependent oxidoreductase n=1 Tax=Halobacteriovorax sp. CON-3 TaxID=3157710 RepID=UPI00371EC5D8
MNYYFYRPEISSYQGEAFRVKERQSLGQLGIKCVDTPIEIPDGESVIVISTSYTDNESIVSSLKHANIALWIHPNSGYDNFSLEFVKNAKFPIVLGNEIRANAVAQFYLQALLNHQGNIPKRQQWDQARSYNRKLLHTKKTLIIGRGPIGARLGNALETLNVSVSYYDPYQNKQQNTKYLKEELANADIIIMACSLNKTSHHILNEDIFTLLKDDVLIMNAARGKLIDQQALVNFLSKNKNAHAIIDVFEKEPIDFNEFKHLSNITLSSHIAGVYKGINDAIIKFEKRVVRDYLHDQELDLYKTALLSSRVKGDFLI